MKEYLRLPLDERKALYKKIAKHVSVFETKADKAEVLAEASKILGMPVTEEKLQRLRETLGMFAKLSNKEIAKVKQVLGE